MLSVGVADDWSLMLSLGRRFLTDGDAARLVGERE